VAALLAKLKLHLSRLFGSRQASLSTHRTDVSLSEATKVEADNSAANSGVAGVASSGQLTLNPTA
jgi:hypothetical protein